MVAIFVVLGPPTSIPVVAGLLTARISVAGALCGILGGIGTNLIARFLGVQIYNAVVSTLQPLIGNVGAVEQIPETALMLVSGIFTIVALLIGSVVCPGNVDYRGRVRGFLDGLASKERVAVPVLAVAIGVLPLGIALPQERNAPGKIEGERYRITLAM